MDIHNVKKDSKKKKKQDVIRELKLALVRECQIWGKSYIETREYFKLQGYTLSRGNWHKMKNELASTRFAKEWFSREALNAMEHDHMISVERIRQMENRLLQDFENIAGTAYVSYADADEKTKTAIRQRSHILLKIIAQFE